MSRVQLALNVGNLTEAVGFYTKLFGTPPAKVRDDYANFVIADPPLKLVLIAGQGEPGSLNHVGVEVETTAQVAAARERLAASGAATRVDNGECCYALQDKVWVDGGEMPWEIYTVLADADRMKPDDSECCAPVAGVPAASVCC
jgi:catechol 2,3-dioxygenase-like lactoylglutathione lyase family enzyme